MVESSRPGTPMAATTVLYVDHDYERRADATATLEATCDSLLVTPADTVAAVEDSAPEASAVVVVHDPPVVDAEAVLDVVPAETPVIVRAGADALPALGARAGVTDYYLRDPAHDAHVARRLAAVTDRSGSDSAPEIFDRMTDAFFALDEEWRLTYVNDEAATILGLAMGREEADPAELEGLGFWAEIPEAVGTEFYETYHEAMAEQVPVTIEEYYEPLDTWFEVRAYPSDSGLSVYFRDITERHRQREHLAERERILRDVYTTIADTEQSFEAQVERLLELGADVLDTEYGTLSHIDGEDYTFEVVHAPDDSIQAGETVPLSATNCERTAARAETVVVEDIPRDAPELASRPGHTEWGISCYVGAPVVVDESVYGTFCFYDSEARTEPFSEWEVTLVDLLAQWVCYELDRRRTHERLKRQNDRLDQFASIVSHDLRNPLNVAMSRLELAQRTGDTDHLEDVADAHDRMASLIEDLLVLAREGTGATDEGPVDLEAAARAAWSQVETADVSLSVETERTLLADRSHLRRLLANLFRNAVEHGEDTESVTVADTDDAFYVADDGPGIPEERRERIFDTGFSTTESGTGLGLAIVEHLVDIHGWSVSVSESANGGARFAFEGVDTVAYED